MIKLMEETMVKVLKERIKSLAVLQKKTKRARKTTLPKEEFESLKQELSNGKTYWDHQTAAMDAVRRRYEITACLNLYHEFRGSEYRHGVPDGDKWYYEKYEKQIREELAKQ